MQLRLPLADSCSVPGTGARGARPEDPTGSRAPTPPGSTASTRADDRQEPARFARNPHARRYVLRLGPDGAPRVTIPRGGSRREAEAFLRRNRRWIERQREKWRDATDSRARAWAVGATVLFRGLRVRVEQAPERASALRIAGETIRCLAGETTRDAATRHFRRLAARELPGRVAALARDVGCAVTRVTVRDQRSRWGSCSPSGAISLNWRLVQMPPEVADYVILHELMHLEQPDHSRRFWRLVRRVCPWANESRAWLRRHGQELL